MGLLISSYVRRQRWLADQIAASVAVIFGGTSSSTIAADSGTAARSSRPDNLQPGAGAPMSATALLLQGRRV